jgi:hypothetical protein
MAGLRSGKGGKTRRYPKHFFQGSNGRKYKRHPINPAVGSVMYPLKKGKHA